MRALPQNGLHPTLEEVAKLAGVSRATASRVFTASPRVSPRAKRAVERAAEKLRYVPNRAARMLVTGRTDSIGLVIPEPTAFLFGDPFFPRLVRGISEVLSRRPESGGHAENQRRLVERGFVRSRTPRTKSACASCSKL